MLERVGADAPAGLPRGSRDASGSQIIAGVALSVAVNRRPPPTASNNAMPNSQLPSGPAPSSFEDTSARDATQTRLSSLKRTEEQHGIQ